MKAHVFFQQGLPLAITTRLLDSAGASTIALVLILGWSVSAGDVLASERKPTSARIELTLDTRPLTDSAPADRPLRWKDFPIGPGQTATVDFRPFDLRAAQTEGLPAQAKLDPPPREDRRQHIVGTVSGQPDTWIGLSFNADGSGVSGFVSQADGLYLLRSTVTGAASPSYWLERFDAKQQAVDHRLELLEQVKSKQVVRAVIALRTPFVPEGQLDPGQLEDQQFAIAALQARVSSKLGSGSMGSGPKSIRARFQHIPHLVIDATREQLERIAALPEVQLIQQDTVNSVSMPVSAVKVGANLAWAAGFNGAGQTIAVIDSGIRTDHVFFPSGKITHQACFSDGNCPGNSNSATGPGSGTNCSQLSNTDATALCGHGTHVASIAGANFTAPNFPTFRGVAWGASLMSFRVLNADGGISGTNVISALDAIAGLAASNTIAAVNISSGTNQTYSTVAACDAVSLAHNNSVANLRSLGIATIAASGNDSQKSGMDHPACMSQVISVGMTTKDTDTIPAASNSASFLDLLAPGSASVGDSPCNGPGICSAVPAGIGSIAWGSGTSQAAPHVSGAFAVLRQKKPSATVDEIVAALKTTGTLLDDPATPATEQIPRINVKAAMDQLSVVAQATLTVQTVGSGQVTSAPAGINCGNAQGQTACSAAFTQGQQVILTATPANGSTFSAWSGDADCTDGMVTMGANKTCIATFVSAAQFTLSVVREGNGSGRVSSAPAGIDCGSQCSAMFVAGSSVSLTATPDAGSSFTRWNGDAQCASSPIVLNANLNCRAEFTLNTPSGPDPRVRLFDFEPPTYSGAVQGLALNGQNGFINPVPASSVSANVHVLTGNSLQLPGNSAGGSQFAGARGPGDGNFVRSQTPTSFASSSTNSCASQLVGSGNRAKLGCGLRSL